MVDPHRSSGFGIQGYSYFILNINILNSTGYYFKFRGYGGHDRKLSSDAHRYSGSAGVRGSSVV